MTLRELIERIERESLNPSTHDLPIHFVQLRKRSGGYDEQRDFFVLDVRVDSQVGIEVTVRPDYWMPA